MRKNITGWTIPALSAGVAFLAAALPAWALSITVNGQGVPFNPPPIERAGRVFVPLRGVFESLGASVVYQNGVINATGNGREISLTIGSTQATVDGQPRSVDVAPFIVGASTYVPLRFVSQALGAGVNYDAANQIVALTTAGEPGPPPAQAMQPPQDMQAHEMRHIFRDLQPGDGALVGSMRPTISGGFARDVDPNSVRLMLDGRDITPEATLSNNGFVYAPPSPLQSGSHTLQADGSLASGERFSQSTTFTSGSAAQLNSLALRSPSEDTPVGDSFIVAGRTLPNARVHIVAGATASLGGVFAFGTGSYTGDTIADADGRFSQVVSLRTVSGATVGVTVTSTDPTTREAAEKKLRLHAQ